MPGKRRHQVVDWPTTGRIAPAVEEVERTLHHWWPATVWDLPADRPWWHSVAPLTVRVPCAEGRTHQIRFEHGELVLVDHPGDVARERAFAVLAGSARCLDVLDAWEGRSRAPDSCLPSAFAPASRARALHALVHGMKVHPDDARTIAALASRDVTGRAGHRVSLWVDTGAENRKGALAISDLPGGRSVTGPMPLRWYRQVWARGLAVVDGRLIEEIVRPAPGGGPNLHVAYLELPTRTPGARRELVRHEGLVRREEDGGAALYRHGTRIAAQSAGR